jgi:hypothetical protein
MTAIEWQRLEGLGVGLFGLVAGYLVMPDWPLWLWPLLLLWPDLAMLGYALGPKGGALCYNLAHLYALPLMLFALGVLGSALGLSAVGALWLAHIGFDRALGFGLKEVSGFQDTHLGRIGRSGR